VVANAAAVELGIVRGSSGGDLVDHTWAGWHNGFTTFVIFVGSIGSVAFEGGLAGRVQTDIVRCATGT